MRHRVLRPVVAALAVATCLVLSAPALACMGNMASTDPGSQAGTATDAGTATASPATDTTLAVAADTTLAATAAPTTATAHIHDRTVPDALAHALVAALSHLAGSLTQALRAVAFLRPML